MTVDLRLEKLSFRYSGIGASDRMILDQIDLTLGRGCTAVVGPSGSGKTTLIQQFTGLLKPVSGRVLADGVDIWSRGYDLTALRRRIGLVFQFPEAQLFEESVARDIAFGPANLGWPEDRIQMAVDRAMALVGLDASRFRERSPFQLSEGEKRRVAIAGVLAMEPEMLVLDEPTAGLDPRGVRGVEELIGALLDQGTAVVLITHNMDFVNDMAARALLMINGRIAFDGDPALLFAEPELLAAGSLSPPLFIEHKRRMAGRWPAALQQIGSMRALRQVVRK